MKIKNKLLLVVLLLNITLSAYAAKDPRWKDWDDQLFKQAKLENKFIVLDLEAVWCHWCHVMAKTTYQHKKVTKILDQHFIAIRVDQDKRPDLANRYRDYGWPATIIFTPDGREIVKRAGYISSKKMVKLLNSLVNKKNSNFKVTAIKPIKYSNSAYLSGKLITQLEYRHKDSFDSKYGSLKLNQKFLDRDSVEYSLLQASRGNRDEEQRAHKTLRAAMSLIDPSWGGVYQYSTQGNWDNPHFEKIMQVQAGYLRTYANAYQQLNKPEYLKAALDIHKYLERFLMGPNGAFYTSQDADLIQGTHSENFFKLSDLERIKKGMPRIDQHQYARENGWAIEALLSLYLATKDKKYLDQAKTAALWVVNNRSLANGGFRHDKKDKFGPYLGDTLAMSKAMLSLYKISKNKAWLKRAILGAKFIADNFQNPKARYISATSTDQVVKPVPQLDENISVTRFYIKLHQQTGKPSHLLYAQHGMKYLSTESIAIDRLTEAGILLADIELKNIISKKKNSALIKTENNNIIATSKNNSTKSKSNQNLNRKHKACFRYLIVQSKNNSSQSLQVCAKTNPKKTHYRYL